MDRLKKDALAHEGRTAATAKQVEEIVTDKARVVTGAWVANGLTCFFVAIIMVISNRLMAAEAAGFKREVIQDVIRAVHDANANGPRK